MGPDRIRAWLNRVPKDAMRIQLIFEQLGTRDTVAMWSRDELASGGDAAQLVCDYAQEHCNDLGTAARYTLQWIGEDGRPQSSKVLRAQPEDGEAVIGAGQVEDATLAGALGQLLRHQEVMARMYVGAQSGILANMQQVLQLQRDQISELAAQQKELLRRTRAAESRSDGEELAAESAESLARASAIEKLSDAVSQHVIPLVMARMNGAAS